MRRISSLLLLFLIVLPVQLFGQNPDLKQTFLEAESYFLFEEYTEALPLYLRIHREDPDNDDINYKIGVCYLNDPYEKDKSIRYLLEASDNINPKYKENNIKERMAPPEVVFYLGKAYLVNDRIDDAIKEFNHFLSIIDEKVYDTELVREQIAACNAAKELKKKPIDTDFINLGNKINTRFADVNPVVSGDEKSIVYVSKLQFYDAAFYSTKVDGEWTAPRNIVPELGVDGDVYPTALSYDGREMFVYRNDDFVGNIYHSRLENGVWTPLVKLGEPISTKFWESHASLSKDGKTLYFTSNRKDGYGGLDIYKSERQSGGSWGTPVNLGPRINTRLNEETPFLSENGQYLFFSSYGHYNMGGYDIFYSKKDENGEWGEPVNLGFPINTTNDDYFFQPVKNGTAGYLSLYRDDGFGRFDIYHLDLYSVDNPRLYMVSGYIQGEENLIDTKDLRIYLVDRQTGDTLTYALPEKDNGAFNFTLPQGFYDIVVKSEKYEDLIRPLRITQTSSKEGIILPGDLNLTLKPEPVQVFTGSQSRIIPEDTVYYTDNGKALTIRMKVEKDSKLEAELFHDSTLVRKNSYDLDSRKFTYTLTPRPGTSTLELKMTESNGDISLKTIIIERTDPEKADVPDIRGTIAAEQPETVKDYSEVTRAIGLLKEQADNGLLKALTDLDPAVQDLNTTAELIGYLRQSADNEQYDAADVDLAAARVIAGDRTADLLRSLAANSSGQMKDLIMQADSTLSVRQLMQELRTGAGSLGLSDSELDTVLGDAINHVPGSAELLLNQLLRLSEGNLRSMLESIDTEQENLVTRADLLTYLHSNLEAFGVGLEELNDLLARYISDDQAELLRQFLLENSEEGLKEAAISLDTQSENFADAKAFMDRLRELASTNDFDEEDIFAALNNAISHNSQVASMLEQLRNLSQGELLRFLETLDLQKDSIYSVNSLVALLLENADKTYSHDELVSALIGLLNASSPADLLDMLKKLAPDRFKKLLKAASLQIDDMDTIADLVRFLLEHAVEYGLSEEDIWNLLLSTHFDSALATGDAGGSGLSDLGRIIAFSGFVAGAGALFIIILFWYRRRKKEETANK